MYARRIRFKRITYTTKNYGNATRRVTEKHATRTTRTTRTSLIRDLATSWFARDLHSDWVTPSLLCSVCVCVSLCVCSCGQRTLRCVWLEARWTTETNLSWTWPTVAPKSMQIAAQAQTLLLLNACCGNMLQQHLLKCNLIVTQGRALQRGAYVIYTTRITIHIVRISAMTALPFDAIRFDSIEIAWEVLMKYLTSAENT